MESPRSVLAGPTRTDPQAFLRVYAIRRAGWDFLSNGHWKRPEVVTSITYGIEYCPGCGVYAAELDRALLIELRMAARPSSPRSALG